MTSLWLSHWPLVVVHMILFQVQPLKVQGGAHLDLRNPAHQKLRRLNEQFQQFQVLTQARLDMLALNQNQNSSRGLERRVQSLADQYHRISQDLDHLRQTTTQEMEALRELSRKLEKKSRRVEARLAVLDRNLRENSRYHTHKQKPAPGQDLSNITLELHGQEGRLASLEDQREALLVGLKGLQESLKSQELRMNRLEGRLSELLQGNGGGYTRGGRSRDPLASNLPPKEDYEPRRRSQSSRGRRPGNTRILDRHTQPRPQDNSYSQSNSDSQATPALKSSPSNPHQHHTQSIPNQPKRSKAHFFNKTPRSQTDSQPQRNLEPQTQFQYPNHNPQPESYRPPRQHPPQSQSQLNQPHPQQESYLRPQPHQSMLRPQTLIQPQSPSPPLAHPYRPSHPHTYPMTNPQYQSQHHPQPQSRAQAQPKSAEDRRLKTRLRTVPPQPTLPQFYPNLKAQPPVSDFHPQSQSGSYQPQVNKWNGGEEEERDVKTESSEIQNFLQLPVRHKIPAQPVPPKDATICNVDSILFFPVASAENYVTFSRSFPELPELSVCLWIRVETGHVGTLLSYATDDNDNQLVLYGRNSSSSSLLDSSLPFSPSSSSPSSSSRSGFDPSYSSLAFSSSSSSSFPPSPSISSATSSSSTLDFVVGDPVYRRLPAGVLLDGHWHHLCILWSSIQGRFWHYTDRRLTSSGSNFRKGWEVPGGGSVVLGQEQDTVGGGFDPAEGFAGRMAGFRVWDRVLSPREVEGVAEGRGVPRGVVLGMEDIEEVRGEVKQVACECLEHCV